MAIEPDKKFCPNCGANQTDEPPPMPPTYVSAVAASPAMAAPAAGSPAPARAGKPALWASAVALVLAIVGGVGYWGWNNKVASDEVIHKMANDEASRKVADAEAAEIKAAQVLLEKHIAAEEAQAQVNAQGTTRKR